MLTPQASVRFQSFALAVFLGAASAPTPLYRVYQERLGFSSLTLTTIFAAYAFGLLASLLTIGSISDYVGRRPTIFSALLANILSMIVFIFADSVAVLFVARLLQGLATGIAMSALGAAILDSDKSKGPVLNSTMPLIGMTIGAVGSGFLVVNAPNPTQLVYALLLALFVLQAIVVWFTPETVQRRSGALASLRPRISIPVQARQAFLFITPANIAVWALGGFFLSLMPSLIRVTTGNASPMLGGLVVSTLTLSGTIAIFLALKHPPARVLAHGTLAVVVGVSVTLVGVYLQTIGLLFLGTVIAGLGFGSSFFGGLRTLLPFAAAAERASLLSAFYVQSYLAFSLPTILIGSLVPLLGLSLASYLYGSGVILLALVSHLAVKRSLQLAAT